MLRAHTGFVVDANLELFDHIRLILTKSVALLKSFACVFWCISKFFCKHEAETRVVWIFLLSLLPTAASPCPPLL